ncbi:MAG: B12-binding domain-containing radical SAM protein [Syntrophobacterales bacterium]|nr:B12-binding domain-containing radical SAM protein [Syntrophobacterales bacterium]
MIKKKEASRERGVTIKKWHGKIPVCVVFPNSYYIGMSNLAIHILYKILNDMPDVVCERCFTGEDGRFLSVESSRPLSAFEIIFITLSFELDYISVPRMLAGSSISVLSEERKDGEPVVVAGGLCVTSNPEPLHQFIDLFIMGDAEATLPSFMEVYREQRGGKRADVLDQIGSFDFVYDPRKLSVSYGEHGTVESFAPSGFNVKIRRFKGKTLGASAVISNATEFSDMFLVEGTRGCPSRCPFCLLGHSYNFTHDDLSDFKAPVKDVGLIGGGVSFHPHLVSLLKDLKERGMTPHLPSLRMDAVPLSVIELIKDDIKTLTFGIEAATERLRRSIGKPLSDEQIFDKIEAILSIKPFNLKLYFMVGLYGESMEDVDAIGSLTKQLKHIMIRAGAKKGVVGSITVHASPFVPKPSTPFQWLPMDDLATLKSKLARLKKILGKVDNTFYTHESVKFSILQGILARGDRRLSWMIRRLASCESFAKELRESPLNLNFYVLRERAENETFPWDFIHGGAGKEMLLKRLHAYTAILSQNT